MVKKVQSGQKIEFTHLMHFTKLRLVICIVLNGQQQENYTNMTAAWFSSLGPWHLNKTQQYKRFWLMGRFTYFISWFD